MRCAVLCLLTYLCSAVQCSAARVLVSTTPYCILLYALQVLCVFFMCG